MRITTDQNYNEAQFLQYVLYVLKNSRSKRQAQVRIQGLLAKRLAKIGNLVEFTPKMIEDYILEKTEENEKKPEKQVPPNPPQ